MKQYRHHLFLMCALIAVAATIDHGIVPHKPGSADITNTNGDIGLRNLPWHRTTGDVTETIPTNLWYPVASKTNDSTADMSYQDYIEV